MAELFPADYLRQLEGLHLLARQLTRGRLRAERRSVKQGSGLEFSDFRPFSPGDDIRAIDWKVYARSRHLLLKLFQEEEDLHVHLLLDCTRSMTWGEPSKFDQARRIVAGLAYLALANLDRAGIAPIGNAELNAWHPSRGRARLLRILRYLEGAEASGDSSSLAQAVRHWLARRPRRGLVVLVTDGWGRTVEDLFQALDRLRYAGHDLGLIQVRHPSEVEAGELGEFQLVDVEGGEERPMIIDQEAAKVYRAAVRRYEDQLEDYCRKHRIAFLRADARQSPTEVLRNALHRGGFAR